MSFGGSSYTPDGECNYVIRCFTFERHQLAWQQCFYPDTTQTSRSPWKAGPSRLAMTRDSDVEALIRHQALKARTTYMSEAELRADTRAPNSGHEAVRVIEALGLCRWDTDESCLARRRLAIARRDSLTGEVLRCPSAPVKKRRRSVDSRTGYADDEVRERWRLRQAELRRRLEDAYARGCNERNEAKERELETKKDVDEGEERAKTPRNLSPGGTDYSGWCRYDQAQPEAEEPIVWDEDVEPDEREGEINGRPIGEAVDLLCRETLSDFSSEDGEEEEEERKKAKAPIVEDYIVIDDDDDGYEEDEEPERAIVAEARALAARRLRLEEARKLRAAHKAVQVQQKLMANYPSTLWKFEEACVREDRLTELKHRLEERKRAFSLACADEEGLKAVADWHGERTDYRPADEIACAVSMCLLADREGVAALDFGYSPSCIGL